MITRSHYEALFTKNKKIVYKNTTLSILILFFGTLLASYSNILFNSGLDYSYMYLLYICLSYPMFLSGIQVCSFSPGLELLARSPSFNAGCCLLNMLKFTLASILFYLHVLQIKYNIKNTSSVVNSISDIRFFVITFNYQYTYPKKCSRSGHRAN